MVLDKSNSWGTWRLAFAVPVLLLVAGCSGGSDGASPPAPPEASKQAAAGTTTTPIEGTTAAFGEPVEYRNGLLVQVSEPKKFEPSAEAITGPEEHFVMVTVRLVNNTGKAVSPSHVSVAVESAGGQAADIIDEANGMTATPPTKKVQPGGKVTWALGFGLIDTTKVKVHVQPGLNPNPVTFAS